MLMSRVKYMDQRGRGGQGEQLMLSSSPLLPQEYCDSVTERGRNSARDEVTHSLWADIEPNSGRQETRQMLLSCPSKYTPPSLLHPKQNAPYFSCPWGSWHPQSSLESPLSMSSCVQVDPRPQRSQGAS